MKPVLLVAALVLSLTAPLVAQRLETFPRFDAAVTFEQAPERVQVGHHGLMGLAIGAVAWLVLRTRAATAHQARCVRRAQETAS